MWYRLVYSKWLHATITKCLHAEFTKTLHGGKYDAAFCQLSSSTGHRASLSLHSKHHLKSWSMQQNPCTRVLNRVVSRSHLPQEFRVYLTLTGKLGLRARSLVSRKCYYSSGGFRMWGSIQTITDSSTAID